MDHVAEEVGLLGVLSLRHRDVRKHLLLKDLLGVVDASLAGEGGDGSTTADEVESDLRGEGKVSVCVLDLRSLSFLAEPSPKLTSRFWMGKASSKQGLSISNISESPRS
jgi:hypothetical protein